MNIFDLTCIHRDISTCLTHLFYLWPWSQFAQSETADGYKLPASDRHAHCKNLLLHQRGAGAVSQLPDGDPEDYIQPRDVWQPAGRHCSRGCVWVHAVYLPITDHLCMSYLGLCAVNDFPPPLWASVRPLEVKPRTCHMWIQLHWLD